MKTICIVWMGYQNIKSYLGAFEDRTEAWHFLMDRGCVQVEGIAYGGEIYREVRPTQKSFDWLKENTKDCPFMYSVYGQLPKISFDTVELNSIVRVYDDD